jgi:hypothetical protein
VRSGALGAKLLLGLGSLVVAAVIGEALVRVLVALRHRDPIVVSHSRLGWVDRPNLRDLLKVYAGGSYRISTDAEGHRLTRVGTRGEQTPSQPLVLLAGDSFVEGVGVNDRETFAWRLASAGLRVVNLGVLGYGTEQETLSVEDFIASHPQSPIAAIVVFVFDNDFVDVQRSLDPYLGRTRPVLRSEGGRLARAPYRVGVVERVMDVSRLAWLLRSQASLALRSPDPPLETGVDLVLGSLATLREVAEQHGASLYVLVHHRLRARRVLSPQMEKKFLESSVAIDITERIGQGSGGDPVGSDGAHWSAEGHRRVAVIVQEVLAAQTAASSERSLQ